jgi:5'(3')-deoxyribonucleotidase
MPVRIYVDMDGVLANFMHGALSLFGKESLLEKGAWPEAITDVTKAIGISGEEFWAEVLHHGVGFWENLGRYGWTKPFIKDLEKASGGEVYILSSPGHGLLAGQAIHGKMIWLCKHLPKYGYEHFIFTREKYLLARPGAILIDDFSEAVDKFGEAGGYGILFRMPWNTKGASVEGGKVECERVLKDVRKAVRQL